MEHTLDLAVLFENSRIVSDFDGPGWLSETDPLVTCQFSRLRTPRTRATELGRAPKLRLVYTRPPCVPSGREHEKGSAAGREKLGDMQKKSFWYILE